MVVIIGDGENVPVSIKVKFVAVYDDQGVSIFAAEQLTGRQLQTGMTNDPDLRDIALRNGLPYRPMEEVTGQFPIVGQSKVYSIKDQ